jgi:hypothetical protein
MYIYFFVLWAGEGGIIFYGLADLIYECGFVALMNVVNNTVVSLASLCCQKSVTVRYSRNIRISEFCFCYPF